MLQLLLLGSHRHSQEATQLVGALWAIWATKEKPWFSNFLFLYAHQCTAADLELLLLLLGAHRHSQEIACHHHSQKTAPRGRFGQFLYDLADKESHTARNFLFLYAHPYMTSS